MDYVKEDIKAAKKLMQSKYRRFYFQKYCSSFLFTTENQEELSKVINYKNKKVATVASAGDQYISSLYYGAADVDIYDINRFSYYITCLKIASILILSYEEFLAFFIPAQDGVNKYFWNVEILKKLLAVLPVDAARFLDEVLYFGKKIGYGDFIFPDDENVRKDNVLRGMPFYYDKKEYYKLQMILRLRIKKYPNFIETDVLQLGEKLSDKYDVIYLSNIIECLVYEELVSNQMFSENYIENGYCDLILKQIMNLLKVDATVLIDYRANSSIENNTDYLFSNKDFIVRELLPKYYSEDGQNNHDYALLYKPSKIKNISK